LTVSTSPSRHLIEGGQRTKDRYGNIIGGADFWANKWAASLRVTCITVKADWSAEGLMAGPIRNARMLTKYGKIDAVIAFPGGKGTADMKRQASLASRSSHGDDGTGRI
jgi:hypothetical protein